MNTNVIRLFAMSLTLAATVATTGCTAGSDHDEDQTPPSAENAGGAESVGKTSEAITVWQNNYVICDTVRLRSANATNGDSIGVMTTGSTFYVDRVDWNTRMAYGYSYQLGQSGWALASCLSTDPIIGGGNG